MLTASVRNALPAGATPLKHNLYDLGSLGKKTTHFCFQTGGDTQGIVCYNNGVNHSARPAGRNKEGE